MVVTGERAVTGEGAFNPSWQRHLAIYGLVSPMLPATRVLDLGCGVGQGMRHLAPRESIGVDLEPTVLPPQGRPGVCADMRFLPFRAGAVGAVVSSHSIEHVPDPERVVAEIARVARGDALVVIATPNRLTFGRPDEIIDPYHFKELDPRELHDMCAARFSDVRVLGLFGSDRYMEIFHRERRKLDRLLGLDPLTLRRFVPRRARQVLYDRMLTWSRRQADPLEASIGPDDFSLRDTDLDAALDLVALCRRPRPVSGGALAG